MKRRRLWRSLLWSFAAGFAGLIFMLYSEMGLRWSVSLLTTVTHLPLSVAQVEGRLIGPFTLSGIDYADTDRRLSLAALTLDWKPSALLSGTVHIRALNANGLQYRQRPGSAEEPAAKGEILLPQIELPLRVIIDEASLDGITLHLPDRAEALTITQLALRAETQRNTLLLHSLALHSNWLTFSTHGKLTPQDNYSIDLMMTWDVPQNETDSYQGRGSLQGDIRKLLLQQHLVAPFKADLSLIATDMLGELAWDGTLAIPELASTQLPYPISPAFSLNAVLKANGSLNAFSSTTRFTGDVETVGTIDGQLDVIYADQQLQLTQGLVNRKKDGARLATKGHLEMTPPLRYQLQAEWQALSWPQEIPAFNSESGRLQLSGEDKNYLFDGDFRLHGIDVPKGEWRFQGKGDAQALELSSLKGKLLDGTVDAALAIKFMPHLQWNGKLKGNALNPGGKWPQWPGHLSLDTVFSGQLPEQGLEVAVSLPSLTGTLRDRKLQGHSNFVLRNGVASLKELELQVGSAHLEAEGELSDEVSLKWELEAARLADLLPQGQGAFKAGGHVTGPQASPRFVVKLDGHALAFEDYRSSRIQADIDIDFQGKDASRLQLQLEQLNIPGLPQQSVTLNADGPLSAHRFTFSSRSDHQTLTMDASAGYAKEKWAGTITRLQIDDQKLGAWRLAQTTAYSFMPGALNIDEFCLVQNKANLCAEGQWESVNGFTASLRSSDFPLQLFTPYLPQQYGINGILNAQAKLEMVPKQPPHVNASLMLGQGRFSLLDLDSESEVMALPFQGLAMHLETDNEAKVDGELTLSLNKNDSIKLTLQSSLAEGWPESPMHHPLQGHARVSVQELGFIAGILPDVQRVHGSVNADVSLSGTLTSPLLSGYAHLDEGGMEIPRVGLSLSGIKLAARGNNTRRMNITGKALSGDGEITLDGELAPTQEGPWSIELAMAGKNFEVAKIPEARMQVSPDLTVRIIGREIHLEGELGIPSARLEPRDLRLAVKPSDDVVIISEDEAKAEREMWLIHTKIRVSAADSIRFIGYGFDGRIGGELLLIDEPGSVTRARGVLHVVPGSSYEAFGTKLTIERGRLNYADSPVDNPNLDIRAARTIGEVIAGVNVSGTAKKPVLTLYSEPPMDQADILSYLTLGHPVSAANQSEGRALAGAASSAGLVGGNYLAGYFGRQFGLEEARVEARQDSQSPWVVVGKYLSPRLYIRYGVGVYEDAYSVILRYQLSEHWQVQGEGGINSGADIIYTFERP